jgi:acetyl-CoA carboxylase biotin carboxyl carrier protein
MELKNIQELIKLVKKADLSELSIKEGDFSITIKNKADELPPVVYNNPLQSTQQAAAKGAAALQESKNETSPAQKPAAELNQENYTTFRSPMVGTFYRKPSVDKDPFVKVGDSVTTGDVLCIIEAMKLFNEIEFDGPAGKILKVLIDDASPVEYDQPLFLIEKN